MNQIRTSALIGLGALGILFGRKMPGVQVIADEARIARYAAQPVVCNGEECRFSYVTPAQGKPVDLLLKATVLDQAIADMKNFVGPDTVILSVLNGITSEEHIETAYPGRTLWSVAIGMDATRSGRTLVFNQAGKIQFGERDGAMTGRVQAVADYLDACGIANEPCSDILYKQWNKLMVNDGLNQAAVAFDLTYGGLRHRPRCTRPCRRSSGWPIWRACPCPATTTSSFCALPCPPSTRTACPACGRTCWQSVPPRWRNLPVWCAPGPKSTACPPPPTTFSMPASRRSRRATASKEDFMDLNHALRFLGFPEDEIPALLEEANAYDPALLERAFADEAMECLPSGCAKKLLGTGLSASFVFHLAMRNVFLLVHCSPLETFRTVLGSDWGDILNENHERHAFGDERVYDFLDRLTTDHLTSDITDLCDTIRDELRTDEESE